MFIVTVMNAIIFTVEILCALLLSGALMYSAWKIVKHVQRSIEATAVSKARMAAMQARDLAMNAYNEFNCLPDFSQTVLYLTRRLEDPTAETLNAILSDFKRNAFELYAHLRHTKDDSGYDPEQLGYEKAHYVVIETYYRQFFQMVMSARSRFDTLQLALQRIFARVQAAPDAFLRLRESLKQLDTSIISLEAEGFKVDKVLGEADEISEIYYNLQPKDWMNILDTLDKLTSQVAILSNTVTAVPGRKKSLQTRYAYLQNYQASLAPRIEGAANKLHMLRAQFPLSFTESCYQRFRAFQEEIIGLLADASEALSVDHQDWDRAERLLSKLELPFRSIQRLMLDVDNLYSNLGRMGCDLPKLAQDARLAIQRELQYARSRTGDQRPVIDALWTLEQNLNELTRLLGCPHPDYSHIAERLRWIQEACLMKHEQSDYIHERSNQGSRWMPEGTMLLGAVS